MDAEERIRELKAEKDYFEKRTNEFRNQCAELEQKVRNEQQRYCDVVKAGGEQVADLKAKLKEAEKRLADEESSRRLLEELIDQKQEALNARLANSWEKVPAEEIEKVVSNYIPIYMFMSGAGRKKNEGVHWTKEQTKELATALIKFLEGKRT